MRKHINIKCKLLRCGLTIMILLIGVEYIKAQGGISERKTYDISGFVYEMERGSIKPLPYASINIIESGLSAISAENGAYALDNLSNGRYQIIVKFLGKISIDTLINVNRDLDLSFTLRNDNFRIKDIVVTAENSKAGQSTSSLITRSAIDHMQATSVADVMSLLPGGLSRNQNLSQTPYLSIRAISDHNNSSNYNSNTFSNGYMMNSLGTSIIQDGAPTSNNANLQVLHPSVLGNTTSFSGGASPAGGIDARSLSTDNIESVEVIRGIPSSQYGDLTSGVVIINSKAGREPLRVNAKTNPNVYQFSVGKGFMLGEKKGALNISGDYAHNTNSVVQSHLYYQRVTAKALYSNSVFNNKWSTNTSLTLASGKDRRRLNEDDVRSQRKSKANDLGTTLNTNGILRLNLGILKSLQYTLASTYNVKEGYNSELLTSANAPYSMTITDGAILSNKPGIEIYDNLGNKLTNISADDRQHFAQYLPASYLGREDIQGSEFNIFANMKAVLFKSFGNTSHRIILGADQKVDKNYGRGKTFDPRTPPYRALSAVNATFRPRKYSDIPALKQFSLYAEESFKYSFGDRNLNIEAGVRYDNYSVVGSILTPRVNASIDLVPEYLSIRGGYGVAAKAPTQLYLYPERAYFEYVNINEHAFGYIPDDDKVYMTTTKIYDTQNSDLEIAKNIRKEVGLDLRVEQFTLSLTAFDDRLNNGYAMSTTTNSFKTFEYTEYNRVDRSAPIYQIRESNPVLAKFFMPTNNLVVKTKGLEYDLNIGRIDIIRTSFNINGALYRTKTYNKDYFYFDGNSTTGGKGRTHIGLYEKGMSKYNTERFNTTLRLTHNIPEIGFVVTLTSQAIWKDANWYNLGNDSIPIKYLSKNDGLVYDFDPEVKDDPEFTGILRTPNERLREKEFITTPVFVFNFNLTKEIGDNMRVSFFANNLLSSYTRRQSQRYSRTTYGYNNPFFFGLELSLKL